MGSIDDVGILRITIFILIVSICLNLVQTLVVGLNTAQLEISTKLNESDIQYDNDDTGYTNNVSINIGSMIPFLNILVSLEYPYPLNIVFTFINVLIAIVLGILILINIKGLIPFI